MFHLSFLLYFLMLASLCLYRIIQTQKPECIIMTDNDPPSPHLERGYLSIMTYDQNNSFKIKNRTELQ